MSEENSKPPKRDVRAARSDSKRLFNQLIDLLDLRGKVKNTGPGVGICEGKDSSKFYRIHHPWSIYNVPMSDLKDAMSRIKKKMPDNGWKVTNYGPDTSELQSLTLQADHPQKFSVNIELWEEPKGSKDPSMIIGTLASACFEAPEGQDVSGEY